MLLLPSKTPSRQPPTAYTTSKPTPDNPTKISAFIDRLLPCSLKRAQIVKIRERFLSLPANVGAHLSNA